MSMKADVVQLRRRVSALNRRLLDVDDAPAERPIDQRCDEFRSELVECISLLGLSGELIVASAASEGEEAVLGAMYAGDLCWGGAWPDQDASSRSRFQSDVRRLLTWLRAIQ